MRTLLLLAVLLFPARSAIGYELAVDALPPAVLQRIEWFRAELDFLAADPRFSPAVDSVRSVIDDAESLLGGAATAVHDRGIGLEAIRWERCGTGSDTCWVLVHRIPSGAVRSDDGLSDPVWYERVDAGFAHLERTIERHRSCLLEEHATAPHGYRVLGIISAMARRLRIELEYARFLVAAGRTPSGTLRASVPDAGLPFYLDLLRTYGVRFTDDFSSPLSEGSPDSLPRIVLPRR